MLLAFARCEFLLVAAEGEVLCWLRSVFCLVVPRGDSWLSPTSGLIAPGTSRRSEDLVWDRLVRARHAGSSGSCAPGFTSPIFRFAEVFLIHEN